MKVFGLIVAILLWILTSFGCTPGEAPQQPEPTQQVEDQVILGEKAILDHASREQGDDALGERVRSDGLPKTMRPGPMSSLTRWNCSLLV